MPQPADNTDRTIYAVSELNELLRALIEDSLPSLWVQGEISNFARPASGHWYFTLKDERAQIRCAMFRNTNYYVRPVPKDGDAVLVRARAGIYPARGELQLIVEHMEAAGTGALLRAFEELKAKLAAEGLFDPARKRPIPEVPSRIGLITSATGAAVHDVLTALQRRWPLAAVFLYPVPVQGAEAAPAIVRALAQLPRRVHGIDVVLLVRGGGSLEDLWAFNDERVARAIRTCAVPVVCGVGHEVDVTIADFAADLRAATPTAAAERVTPDIADRVAHIERLGRRLHELALVPVERAQIAIRRLDDRLRRQDPRRRLLDRAQRLDELALRLSTVAAGLVRTRRMQLAHAQSRLSAVHPGLRLRASSLRLADLEFRLRRALQTDFDRARAHLSRSADVLAALSPRAVLDRGYAIARLSDGRVIRAAIELAPGDAFEVLLAAGRVIAETRASEPD